MSKFKLVFSVLLFFTFFTNLQASELARLCGFSTPSFSPNPICIEDESTITFYGGPYCDNHIFMSLHFANLLGYDVAPNYGVTYDLPTMMPDIYVQLDLDDDGIYEVTIGPIDGFEYHGTQLDGTSVPGTHYLYEHKMNVSQYFSGFDPCPDDDEKRIGARIMQEGSNGLILFDPLAYGTPTDIASCEVFHETCSLCTPNPPNCTSNSSNPIYDVDVCIICDVDCRRLNKSIEVDNQFEVDKSLPIVSPNPFTDEVTIAFDTKKEDVPTAIEIYDWTGALVLSQSFSSDIGKRKINLSLSQLPQGIYYLNLITDEIRTTTKIVKL